MRFDNILVPKTNGLGWTFNYDNPISWVLTVLLAVVLAIVLYPKLKRLINEVKSGR